MSILLKATYRFNAIPIEIPMHLKFILVYDITYWSNFSFAYSFPDVPTPLNEKAIFTSFYASALFSNIN